MTRPKTLRERIQEAASATPTLSRDQLDLKRYPDEALAREKAAGVVRSRAVRQLRSQAAVDAFAARSNGAEIAIGPVRFASVTPITDETGTAIGVDVKLSSPRPGANGDPERHFRVFNPPTLVRDGAGTVTVRGQKYREDPLGALAEAILSVAPSKGGRAAVLAGRKR